MRTDHEWKDRLYKEISRETRIAVFQASYQDLRSRTPALQPYPSPEALVGLLRCKDNPDYAAKDAALHALIVAAQTDPQRRGCELTILLLALWPALEHGYYRLLPHLSKRLPDLFAEIYWSFLTEVQRFNSAKRSKIAINIQMNVERRVRQSVMEETRYRQVKKINSFLEADLNEALEDPNRDRLHQIKDLVDELPPKLLHRSAQRAGRAQKRQGLSQPEQDLLADRIQLAVEQGLLTDEEGALVRDHALRGLELKQIAENLGIRSGTARVRYFRAKSKLQPLADRMGTV